MSIYDNVIEYNGSGDRFDGGVVVEFDTPNVDLGGGGHSSGNNVFRRNEPWDVVNWNENPIMALHNTWTHALRSNIDRYDIYDDDEDASNGAVSF